MKYILHAHYIGVIKVLSCSGYRVYLSHSLPNLKLRINSPKAPKRNANPRVTRNKANARTIIDETPRPL